MKRHWILLALLGVSTAGFAQSADSALGRGSISIGQGNTGFFDFGVVKYNGRVNGQLRFTEVDPMGRPVRGINLPRVMGANFMERSVEFGGPGQIFDAQGRMDVMVRVTAVDAPEGTPDGFSIEARDPAGNVVYRAAGALTRGMIVIRHRPDFNMFAEGQGVIATGQRSAGYFAFGVRSNGSITEGMLRYRDGNSTQVNVAIDVPMVAMSNFGTHNVAFAGRGRLTANNTTVTDVNVQVEALDSPHLTPDRFRIIATDMAGNVVYQAAGDLRSGDIVVIVRMASDSASKG